MKKYEFTGKTMKYEGCTLHQIRALRNLYIPSMSPYSKDIKIRKGNVGGWIESEDNLSHEGNCWVADSAKVYGYASIKDNAYVGGKAIVCCSTIGENARVIDNAEVNEDSEVFGNAIVCDSAVVKGHSKIYGNAEIIRMAQVYYSEIYGGASITGTAKMCFQKLCNAVYYSESRFGEGKSNKKYEFTGKTMKYEGYTLHQIRALRDFYISSRRISVKVGDIGGWIYSEDNLSHEGNCWVDHNAKVYGCQPSIRANAYVGNEATVCGATISGNSQVVGNADVRGFTKVFGNALIGESAVVKGRSKIYGDATIMGTAKVAESDISGSATIRGTIEVYCKTLCKGLYECEDDFREKTPEKCSYEKPLPVDKSLSFYEKQELDRRRIAWRLGRYEDLLWYDL